MAILHKAAHLLPGYVYRGIGARHPALQLARRGKVVPGDVNGVVTPAQHNLGGVSAVSPFTSWTGRLAIARGYANLDGPGGLVVRVPTGAPPPGASWSWEMSPDYFCEDERLLRGSRDLDVVPVP